MTGADEAEVERPVALKAIKAVHTLVWAFFVACIVGIPWASLRGDYRSSGWLAAIVLFEVVVLILNRWRCPLTSVARRCTAQRQANFDIYLPEWLAARNKSIFGVLYFAGTIFAFVLWFRSQR